MGDILGLQFPPGPNTDIGKRLCDLLGVTGAAGVVDLSITPNPDGSATYEGTFIFVDPRGAVNGAEGRRFRTVSPEVTGRLTKEQTSRVTAAIGEAMRT